MRICSHPSQHAVHGWHSRGAVCFATIAPVLSRLPGHAMDQLTTRLLNHLVGAFARSRPLDEALDDIMKAREISEVT